MGGFVFNWLKMPLAWMLGACVFSTIAAFAGLRIGMRVRLRQGMIIILGVLLGSGFSPIWCSSSANGRSASAC